MIRPLPGRVPDSIRRLSRGEFAAALRKGQGRAYLHVERYGLDDVADLVLEACLHNQVFDIDIESLRGEWLFSMFGDTPHLTKFRDAILEALKTETNNRELMQLCELAGQIAALGDDEVREALHDFVVRFASDPKQDGSIGAGDWLQLTGAEGLLELARVYGQRLLANPDDPVYWHSWFIDENPSWMEVLTVNAKEDQAVRAYQEHLQNNLDELASVKPVDNETARRRSHRKIRKQYRLAEILAEARSGFKTRYRRGVVFGRHATQNELKKVYAELIRETDEAAQTRLLWVFRQAQLPGLDDRLFRWADDANDDLRFAAIAALSQVSDERVHRLACKKARSGALLGADCEALGLFINNYKAGDARLIEESLTLLRPDPEDADSLEFSIMRLAEKVADPALEPVVLWAYENTPCAFGRYKTIQWLCKHNFLSEELRSESLFDSEVDIREYIQNH